MRELTNEDILGPGIIIGRENEIIVELRKVLKKISDDEPGRAKRRRKARDRRGAKRMTAPLSHCGRRGAPKGRVDRRAVAAIQRHEPVLFCVAQAISTK